MLLPDFTEEEIEQMPEDKREMVRGLRDVHLGENSMVAELEPDMLTLKYTPKTLIPGGHHTKGTGFEGHGFFEASSIRKIRGKYYFVYSSHKSHELCYALSDRPDGASATAAPSSPTGISASGGRPCRPIPSPTTTAASWR